MSRRSIAGLLCFFWLLGLSAVRLQAAPARPDFVETLAQPDGTRFQARVVGDEWHSRREAASGHTVARDARGVWRYVVDYRARTPVLSGLAADEVPPIILNRSIRPRGEFVRGPERQAAKGGAFASAVDSAFAPQGDPVAGPELAPSAAKPALLYILVDFNDRAGHFPPSTFAATVAAVDQFWAHASGGVSGLVPAVETNGTANDGVVGWLRLNRNHPGGGGNISDANRQVAAAAIQGADPFVNFAAYDLNSDGYVDAHELSVVVVCAGYESSYSGATPGVWGHKWSLNGGVPAVTADGVLLGSYHGGMGGYVQIGEIHKGGSEPVGHAATHGIVVHELGHLTFGLPDLYDTDGSSEGVGDWDVMGGGSWGRVPGGYYGGAPALPSAWTRLTQGWATPLAAGGLVNLQAASSAQVAPGNQIVRIANPSNASEWFLVERRAPSGLDAGLGGIGAVDGHLVWHVDNAKSDNSTECLPGADCVNAHPLLALVQADNACHLEFGSNRGDGGDMFLTGLSFSAGSLPTAMWYSGALANILIEPLAPGQGLLAYADATYAHQPPGTPVITSPQAGAILPSTAISVTWAHRPEAQSYELGGQALGGDGVWRALMPVAVQASSCAGGSCQGSVSAPYIGDLTLTVKAVNASGHSAPATRECSAVVPARPVILGPVDRSVYGLGQKPRLTWAASPGATGYAVRLVDGGGQVAESVSLGASASAWEPAAAPTAGSWVLEISAVGAQGQGRTSATQVTVLSGERRRPPLGVVLGALMW